MKKIYHAAASLDLPVVSLDTRELPVFSLYALAFGGHASFHPLKYIFGLLQVYFSSGGSLLENTRVTEVTVRPSEGV